MKLNLKTIIIGAIALYLIINLLPAVGRLLGWILNGIVTVLVIILIILAIKKLL